MHITKQYGLYKKQSDKIKALFKSKNKGIPKFWALRGVSLEVQSGEVVGLIGLNGSGKSTLADIIAGINPSTTGKMLINGETSIISIGAGLKLQLTGIENIRLKSLMLGLTNSEIESMMPKIIEFAELGDFIYQPVKNYSSGMRSRLGFAIAVHTNPDILIIDEALSVGDDTFYKRCIDKMNEFKAQGKTIFFVSHSLNQVRSFCDKAIWMHNGEVKRAGEALEVANEYEKFVVWFRKLSEKEQREYQNSQLEAQKKFSVDDYYQAVEKELQKARKYTPEKLEETMSAFYHNEEFNKMSIWTKLLIVFILICLGFFVYVNQSPLILRDFLPF